MRKIFTLLAVAVALTASAQKKPFTSNGFFDNWSIGINLGGTAAIHNLGFGPSYTSGRTYTPVAATVAGQGVLSDARSFWQRARFAGGVELTKQWTPIFASVINGQADINTSNCKTFFDRWSISYMNRLNLSNLFFGYNGKPRFFELQAQAGVGMASWILEGEKDSHYLFARFGLCFDFNLGNKRAWTLSVKPAIVYNLDQELYQGNRRRAFTDDHIYRGATFNINDAELEVMAGLTYHFKNSNGEHYFTNVREYDQAEVDALNARVNSLRGQLDGKDAQIAALGAELNDIRAKLNDCLNRPAQIQYVDRPVTVTQTQTQNRHSLTTNVHFRIAKHVIDPSQVPNVERVAIYLKKHPEATVNIEGFASKDGNLEANKALAEARAQAVKNMLIQKYGIAANRINAKGLGVSEVYEELEWNRVSECTIITTDN
ncbi:MAG: OmpA family protein [Bacteroidaceae bacterium]|nr:OmpA family protein [Bacteroidaceae bacterium]